jgi:hypothetical protein
VHAITPTRRYVAVLEGEGPGTSRPILATADPATVAAVIRLIQERLAHPRCLCDPDEDVPS